MYQAMCDFIGIELAIESVPDVTTLLRFRHLLEKHVLTQRIFEEINASLAEAVVLIGIKSEVWVPRSYGVRYIF
ncbi:transposase [Halomonas rhizosphaerae]|uniref:transposase n=1 Tax=Halomonas rhizosphaerae TaxID=3043296 RepID=UPI003898F42B